MEVLNRGYSEQEVRKIKNYYIPNVTIKQYECFGRRKPTPKDNNPTIIKMRVFAKNKVQAKSKYYFFLKKIRKIKKRDCQFLQIAEIQEKADAVQIYGVWFRWNSKDNTHNYYKEFKDVTVCGAVQQMYDDMSSKHRAKGESIQVIKTTTVKENEAKKESVKQYIGDDLKFPLNKYKMKEARKERKLLSYDRPEINNYVIV